MLIIAIVTGLLGLACGIKWLIRFNSSQYTEGGFALGLGFWVFGTVWLLAFLTSLNIHTGTERLTGYIYSADTTFGYTTGHIRFSEQAGADVQPSFCAQADSEAARKIVELAGSGKKVNVTIPPYFYFANNPFACGTTRTTIVETDSQ